MAGTIEEQLKELLEQRDGASAGRASAARPASPIPLGQPVQTAQPVRPAPVSQPVQPVRPARAEQPPQPVRKERAHKRIYMVMLLWSLIGVASLALLAAPTFAITEMPSTVYSYKRPSGISYSGYEAIGLLGSAYWPVACVMLLLLLTCAAMVVTGILRCIQKGRDTVLGHLMAAEIYAYGGLLAVFCIVLKVCTGGQGQSFRIWQEVQWLVVLAVTAFFMARSLNDRYGGFVPTLKPTIRIDGDSVVYRAFYGRYGAWLRSLVAIAVGVTVTVLVDRFTGFSAYTDAETGFFEMSTMLFSLHEKVKDFSFMYFVQYGFTCMVFLLLGKLVSRLTQNPNAVNERLESVVLYPGNVVLMLGVTSIASIPPLSGMLDVFGFFGWALDTLLAIAEGIIIPFRYVVVLLVLLFFVFWIAMVCVMVCYGFIRLIKSMLVFAGCLLAFGALLLLTNSITGGAFEPVANAVDSWLRSNTFASRTVCVAFVVLMNDFLDSTIDRKTDERIDRLIEKLKELWWRLRALPDNCRRKRALRRQQRLQKRQGKAN